MTGEADFVNELGVIAETFRQTKAETTKLVDQLDDIIKEQDANRRRNRLQSLLVAAVTIVILTYVVTGAVARQNDQNAVNERASLNRDRQSCSTALIVNWQAKVGEVLRITYRQPRLTGESPEVQAAVSAMNEATALAIRAPELCYGQSPNPDPVPK